MIGWIACAIHDESFGACRDIAVQIMTDVVVNHDSGVITRLFACAFNGAWVRITVNDGVVTGIFTTAR